ncbi:MAG: site-specific DNA-methyltransferase [Firmicutes bacterium]|nr:site-specific DNA-methyltransferase [Bacillota bacterium]
MNHHDSMLELVWSGKQEAVQAAETPCQKVLCPVIEDSVNWDATENLYIEGDNLDALKLLLPHYEKRIKLIYIDPPYNTGSRDLIYRDGMLRCEWLSFMYPRLKLLHKFLADDGVIFISIDDHEVGHLRCLCDEIFGSTNFITQIVWERAYAPVSLKKHFSKNHDHIVVYAKKRDLLVCNGLERTPESNKRYRNPDNDPRGPWQSDNLTVGPAVPEKCYPITTPKGKVVYPPHGRCWLFTEKRFRELMADNRIWFGKNGNSVPRLKRFLSEVQNRMTPKTIWRYTEVGHSQQAKRELKELFDGLTCFDYPKPVDLIKRILKLYTQSNSIVLDCFSGSATTAHAVMALNAEDGGCRRYIMIQIPEPVPENSPAYQGGFTNICEIGRARIKKAAEQIKKETAADIDYGFRVLRVKEFK